VNHVYETKVNPLEANRDESMLHPDLRMKWLRLAEACLSLGFPIFLVEGYRSARRQELLYASGRSVKGPILTHARAGQSYHEAGRALDFAFRCNDDPWSAKHPWVTVGHMATALGLEWGGDFGKDKVDKPHIQLRDGLTVAQAIAQMKYV